VHMKHDTDPNWKDEPTRRLAVAPDWELRMSNHTVAVSDFREFCITRGEFARVKRDNVRWDLPMASLTKGEVGGISPNKVRDIDDLEVGL
jgi:hypothetical protein